MEEREREEHIKRQQRKYTVLLQEHGKVLNDYVELEQEVSQLDKERSSLQKQMKTILQKVGFKITPEYLEKFEHW